MPQKPEQRKPITIEPSKPVALIGEGKDQQEFFAALCAHLHCSTIQVFGIGGKTQLGNNLRLLRNAPHFDAIKILCIVRDADDSAGSAFQSVCDQLRQNDFVVPEAPFRIASGAPFTAVLIMPGDGKTGALEDLCLESLTENSVMQCVERYFDCLSDAALSFEGNVLAKARMQAFLASRTQAGQQLLRMGEAAQVGQWNFDHAAFQPLAQFMTSLNQLSLDMR